MPSTAAVTFAKIGSVRPAEGKPTRLGVAVVLGGSVAGLLAARVLADHADRVLIIERDETGSGDAPRRGVPQGSQLHALLDAGLRQLERWFPGFTADAVAAGAVHSPGEVRNAYLDGVAKRHRADTTQLTATRPFLEYQVRSRVLRLPNVTMTRGRAVGLEHSMTAVTGVRIESGGTTVVQAADLVVDATGRASRVGDWVADAGWDRPELIRQTTGINYATAFFVREPGPVLWNPVFSTCSPKVAGDMAIAACTAVEKDRWIVLMGGYGECRPGASADDLIRRCRQDFPREFGKVVEGGIIGDVTTYRQADSRRRDFAGTNRFPARLVAVGDAVASFNPIYGQGMSSAALQASCLSLYLHADPDLDRPARHFFDLQKVVVDAAWGISSAADLARPSVVAERPRGYRLSSWLSGTVVNATATDAVVNRQFDEVVNMLAHPSTLARPGILARSLLALAHRRPAPTPSLDSEERQVAHAASE